MGTSLPYRYFIKSGLPSVALYISWRYNEERYKEETKDGLAVTLDRPGRVVQPFFVVRMNSAYENVNSTIGDNCDC